MIRLKDLYDRSENDATSKSAARSWHAPLIVFSGVDGGGKTTQIQATLEYYRRLGHDPVYVWTRGGYTAGFEWLKRTVRRLSGRTLAPAGPSPQRERALKLPFVRRVWLAIAILDLLWVYAVQTRIWRLRGRPVICDRYLWDSALDFEINFASVDVRESRLWRFLKWLAPRPDHAFLLLVPVEESLLRSIQKNEPFPDAPDVLRRRLASYREMMPLYDLTLLDGLRPRDELASWIRASIESRDAPPFEREGPLEDQSSPPA